jgi:hypothetical protein
MAATTATTTVALVERTMDGVRRWAAEAGAQVVGAVTPDGERPLDLAGPSLDMEAAVGTATMAEVVAEVDEGATRNTRQLWLSRSRMRD